MKIKDPIKKDPKKKLKTPKEIKTAKKQTKQATQHG